MNELNDLEIRLRSWVPRRPSAKLKRRIFRQRATREQAEPNFRLSWLPPVTALLLLSCVLFNQHSSQAISSAGSNSLIAAAVSNQSISIAPWLAGSFSREHNGLPTGTFEWTNGSTSSSGIGSRSISNATN